MPLDVEKLMEFPGVGPKIAHLCVNVLRPHDASGIVVDVHVHRISNRLGWVKTNEPEETRIALQDLLPKENWDEINHLLVGFGQQVCQAISPHCNVCMAKPICPSGSKLKK